MKYHRTFYTKTASGESVNEATSAYFLDEMERGYIFRPLSLTKITHSCPLIESAASPAASLAKSTKAKEDGPPPTKATG